MLEKPVVDVTGPICLRQVWLPRQLDTIGQ